MEAGCGRGKGKTWYGQGVKGREGMEDRVCVWGRRG